MKFTAICGVVITLLVFVSSAMGYSVLVDSQNLPSQDPLILNGWVHEIGDGFPQGEQIASYWDETTYRPCPQEIDDPQVPNILVTITNQDIPGDPSLWYVADPETSLTNFDGLINGELAFKIDSLGINKPLVYESLISDNLFQIGESWQFAIQDYSNTLGGQAAPFGSLGIATASMGGPLSTGSIVTPEPATVTLLAVAGLCLLALTRSRRKK